MDCGGPDCGASCTTGVACEASADCVSGVCTGNQCQAPTCADLARNGEESDVDCGGGSCEKCGDGKSCLQLGDCLSGMCTAGTCVSASCTDTVKNGGETDVDCGGSCGKCSDGKACLAGSDCASTLCTGGLCIAQIASASCQAIKLANPAAADGDYLIDPDGAGPLAPLTAFCDMTTDGGGYTEYAITGGISTTRFDQENSCTALGLKMVIPRTQAHLNAMFAKYGLDSFATVPGVYGLAAGNYTGCTMNSGDATCAANWKAIDGGSWFAKNASYSEPNGDYTPGCWLGLDGQGVDDSGFTRFNDANCNYQTGGSYICSDNVKDPAPSASCQAIKLANPAAADGDYLIDPDGAGPLAPLTVFCDMTTDGGGYTEYAITGGISTARFDEENSCTALGLKLAIPRTQAHLAALIAKYGNESFATVPGVYGLAAGDYTGCAMNSSDATCAANWKAIDGGAWFAKNVKFSEPNGDYTPGCWLGSYQNGVDDTGFVGFNDGHCDYSTGDKYICSDNAK
jgi:hypothetical protein